MDKKIALVTGGSGGIGQAIIKELVDENYFVIFTYASQSQKAKEIEKMYEGSTKALQYTSADGYNLILEIITKIKEEYGKLDVLINNLGKTDDRLLVRMSTEDFIDILDTNLVTTFNFTKAALKIMSRQKSGKIINISSVVGITGNMGQCSYSASKSAMYGFTKSLAKEYGRKGITLNCVSPGFIKTPMTDDLNDDIKKEMLRNIALNRFGEPKEVANVISFLASDKANYITGQNIVVDGGIV